MIQARDPMKLALLILVQLTNPQLRHLLLRMVFRRQIQNKVNKQLQPTAMAEEPMAPRLSRQAATSIMV